MARLVRSTAINAPLDAGEATHVTVSADYEVAGGVLGQALDALMMKGNLTKALEQSLKNLKALVEMTAS